MKERRFQFEQSIGKQLGKLESNQKMLDIKLRKLDDSVKRKADLNTVLKPDAETEKALKDLRSISFNHLAPLLDNCLNLSKENEILNYILDESVKRDNDS